jgi:hypothetical protein
MVTAGTAPAGNPPISTASAPTAGGGGVLESPHPATSTPNSTGTTTLRMAVVVNEFSGFEKPTSALPIAECNALICDVAHERTSVPITRSTNIQCAKSTRVKYGLVNSAKGRCSARQRRRQIFTPAADLDRHDLGKERWWAPVGRFPKRARGGDPRPSRARERS